MSDAVLQAHSLAEVYLFLVATPCSACSGALQAMQPINARLSDHHLEIEVNGTCGRCSAHRQWTFHLPKKSSSHANGLINPSSEPSRILDIGQWIMVHSVWMNAASQSTTSARRRVRQIEAGLCLMEALKFHDPSWGDLPPASALFCEPSRERFQHAPEQFSRRRILSLLARLPKPIS